MNMVEKYDLQDKSKPCLTQGWFFIAFLLSCMF